jgi:hypothetical protein
LSLILEDGRLFRAAILFLTSERIERLDRSEILNPDQVEIIAQAFEILLTLKILNDLLDKPEQ